LAYSKPQRHAMLDVFRDELNEYKCANCENNGALS
jgi:hypothetical protein